MKRLKKGRKLSEEEMELLYNFCLNKCKSIYPRKCSEICRGHVAAHALFYHVLSAFLINIDELLKRK